MLYYLRGPHLYGTTVHAFRTEKDRDDAVRSYRLSHISAVPIEWGEVRSIVPADAEGRHLVWGDFANGGPTRVSDAYQRGEG
jgi:hypothetical protein